MIRKLLAICLLACPLFAQTFDTQYQAAQQALTNLDQVAEEDHQNLSSELSDANAQIVQLKQQIQAQPVAVLNNLEFGIFSANINASQVGGSGKCVTALFQSPGINSANFSITPSGGYCDAYFSQKFPGNANANRFVITENFLADSSIANAQAVEWEVHQAQSGQTFDYALQCDFQSNQLRTYNYGGKAWIATSLSCPRWIPGQWNSFVLNAHRDSSSYYYDSISINGASPVPLNIAYPAPATTWSDQITPAVQIDGNSLGKPVVIYAHDISITEYEQ